MTTMRGVFKPVPLPLIRQQAPSLLACHTVGVEAKSATNEELKAKGIRVTNKPHVFKYLDRGHSFAHGFYVIDKELKHVYYHREPERFQKLWNMSIERSNNV